MLRDLLPTFRITSLPRGSRGGGLAVLYRKDFSPKVNRGRSYASFEYLDLTLSYGKILCRFISIYRPPPSLRNKLTFNQFILDFSDLIERIITPQIKIVLAGDFNIHFDLSSDSQTIRFNDILKTFDLIQHVASPTHSSGHTLDLIVTKSIDNDLIISTNVFQILLRTIPMSYVIYVFLNLNVQGCVLLNERSIQSIWNVLYRVSAYLTSVRKTT